MNVGIETIQALTEIISGGRERGGSFPYRSGPDLIQFFNQFGFNDEYDGTFGSRLPFVREKLNKLNNTQKMNAVILAAVDPRAYVKLGLEAEKGVEYLNKFLVFDGYEIYKNGINFELRPLPDTKRTQLSAIKNIIFAAKGLKPEIVLTDAMTNEIKITENEQNCLIYDRNIEEHGLWWSDLVDWWSKKNRLQSQTWHEQTVNLYSRLLESITDSLPEKNLFNYYFSYFILMSGGKVPALIPQVYLHYDPYTVRQLAGKKRLIRQRMDFLMLLPQDKRIVIEVDGVQHYSKNDKPEPSLYAEMVSEDRRLKLAGYEIFRFGGYELNTTAKAEPLVKAFFESLFKREKLEVENKG